jgi:hypothetical protein
MNKARARRLVREHRMTPAGLAAIGSLTAPRLVIATDVKAAFEKDPVAFVEGARGRPAEFHRRLGNLVHKSAKNERFGMVRE